MLTVTDSKDGKVYTVARYDTLTPNDIYIKDGNIYTAGHSNSRQAKMLILKPIKWRAKLGAIFYAVRMHQGQANAYSRVDSHGYVNSGCYNTGNYYQTEFEAQAIADKINNIFQEG